MTDIVEFINARLDEDEQIANGAEWPSWGVESRQGKLVIDTGAGSMGWKFGGPSAVFHCDDPEDGCLDYQRTAEQEAAHIIRHDPARVIREVAAKRAILAEHEPDSADSRGRHPCRGCGVDNSGGWSVDDINECPTLCAVAIAYSDHPNYDPMWSKS